jgi:type I restriction enzyme R subunit
MIENLYSKLKSEGISFEQVWEAYVIVDNKNQRRNKLNMLTDIVSLVKYSLGYTKILSPFSAEVNENFKKWVFEKNAGGGSKSQFTDEQMIWLRMIKDHISTSLSISKEDLELSPFDACGGLGKFYQLFEKTYGYIQILNEMNAALIAA